jgi:hypothetical protein
MQFQSLWEPRVNADSAIKRHRSAGEECVVLSLAHYGRPARSQTRR